MVTTGRWAQFDANLGIIESPGDFEWQDQSGNDHHMFQAGVGSPELMTAEINGDDAVSSYTISGCRLETGAFMPDISIGGAIFLVAKQKSFSGDDNNGIFVSNYNLTGATNNLTIRRGSSSTTTGGVERFSIYSQVREGSNAQSGDLVEEDTFVTIVVYSPDGLNLHIRINGVEGTPVAKGTSPYEIDKLSVFGATYGGVGSKVIAFLSVYDEALTTDEIEQNELYLKNRYNHY